MQQATVDMYIHRPSVYYSRDQNKLSSSSQVGFGSIFGTAACAAAARILLPDEDSLLLLLLLRRAGAGASIKADDGATEGTATDVTTVDGSTWGGEDRPNNGRS